MKLLITLLNKLTLLKELIFIDQVLCPTTFYKHQWVWSKILTL